MNHLKTAKTMLDGFDEDEVITAQDALLFVLAHAAVAQAEALDRMAATYDSLAENNQAQTALAASVALYAI